MRKVEIMWAEKNPSNAGNINIRSRKIGVINPYVLVKLLSTEESSSTLEEIRFSNPETLKKLNAHFKKNKQIKDDLTYDHLFRTKKSPFYKPLGLKPCNYAPLPGNPPYILEPRKNKSEILSDIIQGFAIDDYFLAALHSAAWVYYPVFPSAIHKIAFYQNGVEIVIPVTATFLLDAHYQPVGAQLSPDREYWGCAWEKAYGEFKKLPVSTCPGAKPGRSTPTTPPYDPNVLAFPEGDPLQTLTEITNLPYDFTDETFGFPSAYDDPNNFTSCYDTLNNDNSGATDGTSMITANPTVAWTKDSCPDYSPALVARHAYSILGTFTLNNNGITKYIVLRNPWGIEIDMSKIDANLLPSLAQGGQQGDGYCPPGLDKEIIFGTTSPHGIFGLNDTAFKTYFGGFGWAQDA
ncbi:MAG: hypothetical protein WCB46_12085 [Methanoregula sp.]